MAARRIPIGAIRIAAAMGLMAAFGVDLQGTGVRAAEPPSGKLDQIERAIREGRDRQESLKERSADLNEEAEALRRQRIESAAKVQEFEAELTRLEGRVAELVAEEQGKGAALVRGREQAVRVVMAVQRMARFPPEALIAQPMPPADMVRSAILLRSAIPRLEAQAQDLRRDLIALERSRMETAARRRELVFAADSLRLERTTLAALIEKNAAARSETAAATRQTTREVQALARQAKDLQQLMERLESDRRERREREERERVATLRAVPPGKPAAPAAVPAPRSSQPSGTSFSKARGTLVFPAAGEIAGQFGEATATGLTRKGIDVVTRAGAQVVAPYDGTVVYAGEFRGYGELLIIEHGEGYHSLLAGMARIDAALGQKLTAGEPVGIMAGQGGGKPALYLELRRDGQPINPMPWLSARSSKGNG